jgi:hypothetical protein
MKPRTGRLTMQKPPKLTPGARIATVSTSWGGPGAIPHRYEVGKRQLMERFQVEVVEMPHTLARLTTSMIIGDLPC